MTRSPARIAYKQPDAIYPAVHYTMGGLWVDYNLMSNVPGLHVLGEANFSDHGANRLGACALMQGLADGYFVIPTTIANYLATQKPGTVTSRPARVQSRSRPKSRERTNKMLSIKGKRTVDSFHRELGLLMWDKCGMARTARRPHRGPRENPRNSARNSGTTSASPAPATTLNMELEKAGRVADFLEFGELMCHDALDREESCGGHFRTEHQTEDGEAMRHDDQFAYVSAWEYKGDGQTPELHKEELEFEAVHLSTRSYK